MENATFSVDMILQTGTSVLTWIISCFGSLFDFFLAHPGLLIAFVMSIVGTAIVYFRNLV